jgi:YbbR domain-containing protein
MIPLLQDLVLKDFWLKLFSFALATLIWFTVNIAIKNDISPVASLSLAPTEQAILRDLPITVLSSAQPVGRFSINPKTANVTVQGDAASLRNLRRENVRVLVDLSDNGALQNSQRRLEVSTPAGITHVRVDPEEVEVATESKN